MTNALIGKYVVATRCSYRETYQGFGIIRSPIGSDLYLVEELDPTTMTPNGVSVIYSIEGLRDRQEANKISFIKFRFYDEAVFRAKFPPRPDGKQAVPVDDLEGKTLEKPLPSFWPLTKEEFEMATGEAQT